MKGLVEFLDRFFVGFREATSLSDKDRNSNTGVGTERVILGEMIIMGGKPLAEKSNRSS